MRLRTTLAIVGGSVLLASCGAHDDQAAAGSDGGDEADTGMDAWSDAGGVGSPGIDAQVNDSGSSAGFDAGVGSAGMDAQVDGSGSSAGFDAGVGSAGMDAQVDGSGSSAQFDGGVVSLCQADGGTRIACGAPASCKGGVCVPSVCTGVLAFPDPPSRPTDASPGVVASGDLDGDGLADLVVLRNDSVSVLLGLGNGTFRPASDYALGRGSDASTPARTFSLAIADLNGDGKADIAVSGYDASGSSAVSVLLNRGRGTFAAAVQYRTVLSPASLAVGDLDGDGKPDLAVSDPQDDVVSVLVNKGNGTFGAPVNHVMSTSTERYPAALAAVDLNGDGWLDLAFASSYQDQVSVVLNDGHGNFGPPLDYPTCANASSPHPTAVAAADLNGDGKPDLAVACENGVSVLFSRGDGTLAAAITYDEASPPQSVAAADLNGDGRLDLVVGHLFGDNVGVLLNLGNGTFGSEGLFPAGAGADAVAAVDLNGDGHPDLAVANDESGDVSVLLNQGPGTFTAAVIYDEGSDPQGVAVADLDGDGWGDIVVSSRINDSVDVLLNRGGSAFAAARYPAGSHPCAVAAADLNGDDKPDLASISCDGLDEVSVLLNQGKGTFAAPVPYVGGQRARSVTIADLNGDNKADLAVAYEASANSNSSSGIVSVLFNLGNGTFAPAVTYSLGQLPTSIAAADLNGDGHADLVVGISALQSSDLDYVDVLLNEGSGTFAPAIAYPTGVSPVAIVALDLNEDGKPDLAVADRGSDEVRLFMNHGDGTLSPGVASALGSSPRSMIAADLNGDGKPDLAVACGTDDGIGSNVTLLLSLGAGTFAPASTYAAGKAPTSIAAGDLNADGKPDLAVANPIDNDNNVRVLFNTCLP